MIPFWRQGGAILFVLFLLGACATSSVTREGVRRSVEPERPPVSEQSVPLRQPESPYRTVVHGDTLYSIAWEAGQDYRVLADWNGIKPPYTITPGQELRIKPSSPESATRTVVHGDTLYGIASETGRDYRALAAWNDIKPPYTILPGQELRMQPPETENSMAPAPAKKGNKGAVASKNINKKPKWTATPAPVKPVATSSAPKQTKNEVRTKTTVKPSKAGKAVAIAGPWMWPADGQLLKRYSESDAAKGLDIGGARGQAVRASANGRVVYQGSGLRGYGQLIIIKHNDEYLSAYAHNDRIYVKEGDVVKRGQKIADMGSTGTDRVKLHFEIRRQGAPIDPLKFLPKR